MTTSHFMQDTRSRIQSAAEPDDVWLWCSKCEKFFQYANASPSCTSPRDACPFPGCTGDGLGFQLLWWDDRREPADPRWPASVDQLTHGMNSPEMESFYDAQLAARIENLVSDFARSPEAAAALGGAAPRYLGHFLKMTSDLSWDLTDPADLGFADHLARELIAELPVWSRTADLQEAPRMTAELRAFFAFATRTDAIKDAAQWSALVAEHHLDETFIHTMQTDQRLQPRPRPRPRPRPHPRPTPPCASRSSQRLRRKTKRKQRRDSRRRNR